MCQSNTIQEAARRSIEHATVTRQTNLEFQPLMMEFSWSRATC